MIRPIQVLWWTFALYTRTAFCEVFVNSENDLEGSICYAESGDLGTCKRSCPGALWERYRANICNPGQFPILYCCMDAKIQDLFPSIHEVCMSRNLVATIQSKKKRGNNEFMEYCEESETFLRGDAKKHLLAYCDQIEELSSISFSVPSGVMNLHDPSIAAIGFDDGSGRIRWICVGHFVHKAFVLTSGYCIKQQMNQPNIVRFGGLDSAETELNGSSKNAVTYDIARYFFSPNYSNKSLAYDLVLLQVRTNFTGQFGPIPACLWTKRDVPRKNLTLVGYSDTWQESSATKTSLTDCANKLGVEKLNGTMASCYVCGFKDQGPITASLHYNEKLQVEVPYLVGMGSCGLPCNGDDPAYFSYIYPQLSWIENIFFSYRIRINY